MVKIDWIEIPRGKFYVGLSDKQIAAIRARVRAEAGTDKLDAKKRTLIERVVEKFALWRKGQLHLDYKTGKGWNLPPEENEIATDRNFEPIIRIEASLQHEKPQQCVELNTFYIARFPVTNEQCNEFFTYASRVWPGDWHIGPHSREPINFPVEAPWPLADIFCHWVGGRLPTAAEWQKAARGRGQRLYPWGNQWESARGNFIESRKAPGRPATSSDTSSYKTPVDAYPNGASPYGVCDMVGNVAEWTMSIKRTGLETTAYREGPVVCGNGVKNSSSPYWFYNILTQQRVLRFDSTPVYIGFRPVRDQWQREHWQGFRVDE